MPVLQLPRAHAAVPGVWPRRAIHDTVAAIASQPPYDRSLRQTLLERILRWTGELFARLDAMVGGLPHARRIATVAAILTALMVIGRLLYAARLRDESTPGPRRARTGRGTVGDPWREAERLAGEGQYSEAAHALYHAVIQQLAGSGQVRLHRSKTSGDYARELRAQGSPAQQSFRRFVRRYDRILFGERRCDAAGFEALLADARPVIDALQTERVA